MMGDLPSFPIHDVIANNGRLHGRKAAVVCGDQRASWEEFDAGVNRVANGLLEIGLKRNQKVCLLMETSIGMLEVIWGVIRAGGVVVPLNPTLPADTLAFMINKCNGNMILADADFVPLVETLRPELSSIAEQGFWVYGSVPAGWQDAGEVFARSSPNEPDITVAMSDTMDITFTSGTTGRPKGIELAHLARFNYAIGIGSALQMSRFSVTICTTPLYTNGCWVLMVPTLYWGGTLVLLRRFEPNLFLDVVARERCTHLYLLPPQAINVTNASGAANYICQHALRILSGGAMLPEKTQLRLTELFPAAEVHLLYGQSEGFSTVAGPKDFALGKQGSMGMAVFGTDLRVIDREGKDLGYGASGEIVFHGPGMMKGYYEDPPATEKIIWRGPHGRIYYRTGDFGRIDEDGYLFFIGRTQDVIVYEGAVVYASELESVFVQHPAVTEVAVVGVPHRTRGELPILFAILREGDGVSEQQLLEWGAERLQKHKHVVAAVEFRTQFPRASLDKIQKNVLRSTCRIIETL